MTTPDARPPDDELASAYLDGELDDATRAAVEADAALVRRADELRRVAALVGADEPLDETAIDQLIGRALAAAPTTPARRAPTRAVLGIAAALVLALVVSASVLRRSSDDTATSSSAKSRAATALTAEGSAPAFAADAGGAPATAPSTTVAAAASSAGTVAYLGSFASDDELVAALRASAPASRLDTAPNTAPATTRSCPGTETPRAVATVAGRTVAVVVTGSVLRLVDLATCTARERAA